MTLDQLTDALRALRLPGESAVIISVGSERDPECGERGAISVTATSGKHTETSTALHLQDALLMVRARLNEAHERAEKARLEAKAAA